MYQYILVIPLILTSIPTLNSNKSTTLYENITVQCITENKDTQHVVWSYVDLDGSRSVLNSPTSLTTGVSTLSVSTDKPGYYSCQVTQQTGVSRTYGVRIRDFTSLQGSGAISSLVDSNPEKIIIIVCICI